MCLLVVAWRSHARYRLVVAANRDEFHDRPSAPLGWWSEDGRILAGRDLRAGGTWLGVTRSGRFGAVTNFRDLESPPAPGMPSRGTLVPRFLAAEADSAVFLAGLDGEASRYAGFNLLVGGGAALHYFSNRGDAGPRELEPGVYGLSNHWLDSPWPKLVRTRERLAAAIADAEPEAEFLFDLLADREPASGGAATGAELPADWERALSAPFVRHDRYGTRCSTVVLAGHDGRTRVHERRFDAAGRQTGATRFEFDGNGRS
jgi:uncharacterized protein with NRDE domain